MGGELVYLYSILYSRVILESEIPTPLICAHLIREANDIELA